MLRIFCLVVGVFFTIIIELSGNNDHTYPNFPRQAEFIIEKIRFGNHIERTFVEYIYDYDNNRLITNNEGTIQYYNYAIRKKSIYSIRKQCNVYPIDIDNSLDGLSAVTNPEDGKSHIRPLYDLLLLTSNATYHNEAILRGYINVNQWISSVSNDLDFIWSFAKSTYTMPWAVDDYVIPVQRITKGKDDEAILEVSNIFSYKTKIIKSDLTPPKGIYCEDLIPRRELLSLQDEGIEFPDKFSVRIDASSTSQQLWRSVHLRYHQTNERKLIRYDYTPNDNTQNPVTIILDYARDVLRSYTIDRRTGSCMINQSVEITLLTSVLHSPIEALIKHENLLLNPSLRAFQYSGNRPCRGSLLCSIYIGRMPRFPPDIEEDWLATNMEWAWSKRNFEENNAPFDYPVYLDLNLYRNFNEPPANIHYEFYEYRTDVHLNEFDVNLCYRSNQLLYQHLAFELEIKRQSTVVNPEDNSINRRRLAEHIHGLIISVMSIKYLRISQLEIDHHPKQPGHNDTLYCIFTLLDRTPFVDPDSEAELSVARQLLNDSIDAGDFQFETVEGLLIEAVKGSLEDVEYFYAFNPNVSVNQIDLFSNITVHVNRTIIQTIEEIHVKIQYSIGAQAGAITGGIVVGILFGTLMILIVIKMVKRKTATSPTGKLTIQNISFHTDRKKEQATVTMEHSEHNQNETDT